MKAIGASLVSLAMIGALAGCQGKYESDARATAAAQNAESAATRAEAAARRVEQAATRAEAAAQRAEAVVQKMDSESGPGRHARGHR
jgi:hypothetical protein